MAFEFKLPDIGEGVVEGEIVKWLVKPGDRIELDQPMVEVMTDKATVVIPSPRAGIVLETRGKEGDIAKVHSVLVVIDERAGATAASPPKAQTAPAVHRAEPPASGMHAAYSPSRNDPPKPVRSASGPPLTAQVVAPAERPPPASALHVSANGRRLNGEPEDGEHPAGKVLAAPATRRLARELGVDLVRLSGSGPAGRVTSEDVRRAATGHASDAVRPGDGRRAPDHEELRAPLPSVRREDERIPVRGLRKRIWENMARSSFTAAHFTFVEECDGSELVRIRERHNAELGSVEDKLTYLPFIVKAVIVALKRFPDLNAHVDDEKMEYIRRSEFHIGIAAASERGLIVPVVRHADRRSILDIGREIKRLGDATRAGTVQPQDLGGSTFTITSLGKDGGIFATPIINYPEVAIMGVHKMVKRPMVVDDQIAIRHMMNLSLSFDHRLIDGHVGAAFTYAVIRLLEHPERLMMELA